MILKETLRAIVRAQKEELALFEYGIERESLKEIHIELPFATVISGIRRCGKSTLLRQIARQVKNFYYFNFEDPRATNFEVQDFQKLDDVFFEEFGKAEHYFFDEIQSVSKWELLVRAFLDKKKRVIITGSNASLLSKELGTRLTGRHLRCELFPFSFKEFLKLVRQKPGIRAFEDYFKAGGFPEFLKVQKAGILQELFNDIIIRDIVSRHKIRSVKTIREMALYLLTNIGKEFSYNSLRRLFQLGSTSSAVSFVSYFEDSYLLFTVPKFDYSLKKQLVNPKKVYSIDNGLSNANSASFSEDKGKMLENAVFLGLRRRYKGIFYFREKGECDFVIKEGTKITKAIQVCYDLNDDNKEREIGGLVEVLGKFQLKEGFIITYNQADELQIGNKTVKVLPVWKWLL